MRGFFQRLGVRRMQGFMKVFIQQLNMVHTVYLEGPVIIFQEAQRLQIPCVCLIEESRRPDLSVGTLSCGIKVVERQTLAVQYRILYERELFRSDSVLPSAKNQP